MTAERLKESKKTLKERLIYGSIGLILAVVVYFAVPGSEYPEAPFAAAIITLMAAWWIMEVIPIPATSLLPLLLFPIVGIAPISDTSAFYYKPIIFLFLGGFILAMGLQSSGIHKRIALKIVGVIGSSPKRLILGFMVATWALSMWISNTATVMVMLPISLSIMAGVEKEVEDPRLIRNFGVCLMLGIAYSADIGGMATLIGTPPNLIFLEMYQSLFPDKAPISFLEWMLICFPMSLLFLVCGWYILTHWIYRLPKLKMFSDDQEIQKQRIALGKMNRDEKLTGIIFLLTALAWMTGSDITISGDFVIHGWRYWLGAENVTDPVVAMIGAFFIFMIPSRKKKGKMLMSVKDIGKIPWGILLLFGGGFAIAGGFESSGLSKLVESIFTNLPDIHPLVIVLIIAIFVTFLTELATNSAVTTLLLPILATGALTLSIDPKLMMIPATLSASCAFMMPIASPTQAIVFGSGYVNIKQMMRAGIWFNLLGIALVMILFSLIYNFWWS